MRTALFLLWKGVPASAIFGNESLEEWDDVMVGACQLILAEFMGADTSLTGE